MTRKRFVKLLRGMGAPENTIKNYINLVYKCGGKISYQEIYNKLFEYFIKRFICGDEQLKMEFAPVELNYNDNQTDYLLKYYQSKVIQASGIIQINES